jgi:argininosuccinate lyase
LFSGWFHLSALFTDGLRHSIESTSSMDSPLEGIFYHSFIIAGLNTWVSEIIVFLSHDFLSTINAKNFGKFINGSGEKS